MDGMNYESTKVSKKPSQTAVKKAVAKELDQFNTSRILWYLVKRHKLAISVTLNVILIVNWALPAWPSIVRSLV